MHLIHFQGVGHYTSFYQNRKPLTRPDSLPCIFRKLRIHRNFTRKAFAEKLGFSEEYVSQIESGSKFSSLNFCLKCADEFGANPSWVKTKWAKEALERFTDRLMKRLGLND